MFTPGIPVRVQKGLSRPTHHTYTVASAPSHSPSSSSAASRRASPFPLGRLSACLPSILATILTYLGRLPTCLNPPLGVPCPSASIVFQTVYHVSEAALYALGAA